MGPPRVTAAEEVEFRLRGGGSLGDEAEVAVFKFEQNPATVQTACQLLIMTMTILSRVGASISVKLNRIISKW